MDESDDAHDPVALISKMGCSESLTSLLRWRNPSLSTILNFQAVISKVLGVFFVVAMMVNVCIGVDFYCFFLSFFVRVSTFLTINCVDSRTRIRTRINVD